MALRGMLLVFLLTSSLMFGVGVWWVNKQDSEQEKVKALSAQQALASYQQQLATVEPQQSELAEENTDLADLWPAGWPIDESIGSGDIKLTDLLTLSPTTDPKARAFRVLALRYYSASKEASNAIFDALFDSHPLVRVVAASCMEEFPVRHLPRFESWEKLFNSEPGISQCAIFAMRSLGKSAKVYQYDLSHYIDEALQGKRLNASLIASLQELLAALQEVKSD